MKKRMLVTLLSLALTASLTCGCGNRSDQSMAAETDPVTVESTESSEEGVSTAEPETNGETEDGKGSEEQPEAAPTPEPTQAPEVTPDTQETPIQESGEATESSEELPQESAAATPVPEETAPQAVETPVTTPLAEQTPPYTVTEMSATMYAQNAVNLRQGPGTEYAKVGNLTKGQQVIVTGQAGNGWYQLDNGAFVSNKYLGDVAPVQQAAVAETMPVDPVEPIDQVSVIVNPTASVSSGIDFVNYLNQQRSAAGLGTLTWDDGMATVAQRRAKEISTDLSHNGNVEKYGEIIQLAVTGNAADWYTSWYNSDAHRSSMMTANYTRAGCAVYAIGNNYYVVCNFAGTPISMEQLIEQSQPENLVPAGGNESGTTTSYSTTGETIDADDPDYGFIYDLFEQERERLNN